MLKVTDEAGTLHYAPFPICNETASPLAFRYGVSEPVSCTLDALDDEMYHLFEYYVHSDVPLTCRVPTLPLGSGSGEAIGGTSNDEGVAFTPLTVALQGTLQLSHLHMWTDMNVLLHRAGVWLPGAKKGKDAKKEKDKKKREKERKKKLKELKKQPGLVYAGTAYSLPSDRGGAEEEEVDEEVDDVENVSLDPWAAGHGAKVVRGEPLTFTFRVSWVHGEDVPDMAGSSGGKGEAAGGVLSSMFFFLMAGGIGALLALSWDKWYKNRRGGGGWSGDGLLGGRSTPGKIVIGNSNFGSGKTNGYGGYNGGVATNGGYGGYSSGKRD